MASARGAMMGRRLLGRSALVLGACVASLVLAEIAVRVLLPQRISWMPIFTKHPAKPMTAVLANVDLTADAGETVWRVCTDDLGLRTTQPGPRARGDVEVLFLGDSFTFGYAVDDAQGFVGLLAARLQPGKRIVNGAQPAYGPTQYRMQLEWLLAEGWRPRSIVIVAYSGNDVLDAMIDKDLPTHDGLLGDDPGWRHRLRSSHLYRLGARLYKALVTQSPRWRHDDVTQMDPRTWEQPEFQRAWQVVADEFVAMRAIAGRVGATLHVAIVPPTFAVDVRGGHAKPMPGLDAELPMRRLLAACKLANIEALDLTNSLAAVPSERCFLPYDGHFSPEGHRLVADALQGWCADLR